MRRDYSIETLQQMQLADDIKQQVLELAEQREKEVASVEYEVLHTKQNKRGITVISNHSKIRTRYNTMIGTLIKHGVTTVWKLPEVREKELQTKEERYGTKYVGDRDKAKQTKLAKGSDGDGYNGKQYVNSEKAQQTKLERYGSASYVNPELANETKIERGIVAGHESFQRAIITKRSKYGEHLEEVVIKTMQTCLERYGVESFVETKRYRTAGRTKSKLNQWWHKQLLDKFGVDFEYEKYVHGHNYDLCSDEYHLLIEINPVWSHNSTYSYAQMMKLSNKRSPIEPNYHSIIQQYAIAAGYHCIQIWDWDDKDKVLAYIGRLLNKITNRLYARQLKVKQIHQKIAKQFEALYHLQGALHSQPICFGLYYDDKLVQVMTFGKTRHGRKSNTDDYELLRFCTHINYEVVGGAQRLFTHFIRMYKPQTIVSYCDLSKFTGQLYSKLKFKLKDTRLCRHWYHIGTWRHLLDSSLRMLGADKLIGTSYGKGTSNYDIMIANDWVEIYDCGQQTWLWQK